MVNIVLAKDKQTQEVILVARGEDIYEHRILLNQTFGFEFHPSLRIWYRPFDLKVTRDLNGWVEAEVSKMVMDYYNSQVKLQAPTPEYDHTFKYQMLKDYQDLGVKTALNAGSFLFADDMGLGKTPQTLAIAEHYGARTLVICPSTLKEEWTNQIEKFTCSTYMIIEGAPKRRAQLWEMAKAGSHYAIFSWDGLRNAQDFKAAQKYVTDGVLIFDEITKGKNAQSQRAKAAARLQAKIVLGISGSPLENNLEELWHIFRLVRPELFPSFAKYAEMFLVREEQFMGGHTFTQTVGYKNVDLLKGMIQPYYIRRLRSEVLDLPPASTVVRKVHLNEAQTRIEELLLKAAKEAYKMIMAGVGDHRASVLKYFTYGMENFLSPALIPTNWEPLDGSEIEPLLLEEVLKVSRDPTPREQEILDILKESTPNPMVLFSGFKKELLRLAPMTKEPIAWLTSGVDVQEELDKWKAGEARILMMTVAGAEGHNLQEHCHMMTIINSLHNPRKMDQLLARIHRYGQNQGAVYYALDSNSIIEGRIQMNTAEKNILSGEIFGNTDLALKVMC